MQSTGLALSSDITTAAQFCYDLYLSKKYSLTDSERYPKNESFKGYVVQRPNHGLVHVLRKANYVPYVVEACKLIGLRTLNYNHSVIEIKTEIENIQLAMIFSVCGRESEASFKDAPDLYRKFREKSAERFENFILTNKDKFPKCRELVQTQKLSFYKRMVLSPHENKNLISKIFIICHNLDLVRCYTNEEFSAAIESVKAEFGLLGDKEKQFPHLIKNLKDYAINCITATGDKISPLGTSRVAELFVACSINAKTCTDVLRKVSPPRFFAHKLNPKPEKSVTITPQMIYQQGIVHYQAKNYQKAFQKFQKASTEGSFEAKCMLGLCYLKGRGVVIDNGLALKYLQEAANQKSPTALYTIGICLLNGQGGCKIDKTKSQQYLQLAKSAGSQEAKIVLETHFK